ncbi:hypothetical protein CK203_046900 [Vitis vinifera]|uniref:Uncharacterized protein n=1 Tax=Vitis vinifera TaxID=29760 RepID=A0A438HE82_VITVI|nr:hypothetical protein CK203_046900 [Vitis vinifera]
MSTKTYVNISDSKKSSMVTIHETASPTILLSWMVLIIVFGVKIWRCILLVEIEGIYHKKEVKRSYFDVSDSSQEYALMKKCFQSCHGGCPRAEYYNELNLIFMEIDY